MLNVVLEEFGLDNFERRRLSHFAVVLLLNQTKENIENLVKGL